MARLTHPSVEGATYHTISITRDRKPVFADPGCARIVIDTMTFIRERGDAFVLAYALMPDHLHLLLVPREGRSLSQVMHSLKLYSARKLNSHLSTSGAFWQEGYFDRLIRSDQHLAVTSDYIERNPVVAGLVSAPEEYTYSSAHPDASTDAQAFNDG